MNIPEIEPDGVYGETNARAMLPPRPVTRAQVLAIANLENEWTEMRGITVSSDAIERVLHVFTCVPMANCVCANRRDADGNVIS